MIDLRIPDHNGSIICILLPNPTENDKKKCWADGSGHTPASFCLEFSEIKTITYGTQLGGKEKVLIIEQKSGGQLVIPIKSVDPSIDFDPSIDYRIEYRTIKFWERVVYLD